MPVKVRKWPLSVDTIRWLSRVSRQVIWWTSCIRTSAFDPDKDPSNFWKEVEANQWAANLRKRSEVCAVTKRDLLLHYVPVEWCAEFTFTSHLPRFHESFLQPEVCLEYPMQEFEVQSAVRELFFFFIAPIPFCYRSRSHYYLVWRMLRTSIDHKIFLQIPRPLCFFHTQSWTLVRWLWISK